MTKIYYGRDLIGRFNCDGRKYSKFQLFLFKAKRLFKTSLKAMAVFCAIGWGFVAGGHYFAKTDIVRAEVIKEVGTKFEDIPMLVKICTAESGGKQFKKNGDVVRGVVNPSDVGICQINEYINNDEARRLGYDIFTEKGNKDYAVYLFMHRGTEPWNSSRNVWCKGCSKLQ
jgi:hypothetical protein